ncbi:LLM class flavin-dependent oxidoreductase [Isoptericola haloaureus]|uniref:LLM class flavin-dependent oxidoreductase n=1 Tax=Isoptericola haloaureus TaxID=1542902 RepID=A0ABU7ZBL7_9MICO
MRFGFVSSFGTPVQHVELARACEEHGWDGFFTWDGVSLGELGEGAVATWDPFGILAAAAAVTEHVTLGAMVFALPRHRPWELAQRALTVDHLSGGRLVLPVGVGVTDDRGFSSVPGQPLALRDRAAALDETLAWLERSWTGEPFAAEGEHVRTGEFQFPQRPVAGRIPVWPVGVWDAARPPVANLRRALRWDGVVPQLRGTAEVPGPDDVEGLVAWIEAERSRQDDAGRPFDVVVQGRLPDDGAAAAELVAALREAGATWWVESRWDPAEATPESLLARVRQGPPAS